MSTENEQKLAEAVRKYPVLYDKQDKYFKDRNKKKLAWKDVSIEANLQNHGNPLNFNDLMCDNILTRFLNSFDML